MHDFDWDGLPKGLQVGDNRMIYRVGTESKIVTVYHGRHRKF
jgi:hypothetical protein